MVRRKYSVVRWSKKNNWNQISRYLKACEYVDRNDDICKNRIHNLTNVYGNTYTKKYSPLNQRQ